MMIELIRSVELGFLSVPAVDCSQKRYLLFLFNSTITSSAFINMKFTKNANRNCLISLIYCLHTILSYFGNDSRLQK